MEPGATDHQASRPTARGRVRSVAAAVAVVLGLLLSPVAVVAAETRAVLTDTDRFVATFAPLAQEPVVQDAVADATIDALGRAVDFDELAGVALARVSSQLGLGPVATVALGRLLDQAAAALRSSVEGAVRGAVSSDRFVGVWEPMLRQTHARTVAAIEADPDSSLVFDDDVVVLQLGPVVEAARQRLLDRGVAAAALLPATDRTVPLGEIPGLRYAGVAYRLATVAGAWLPWLALALLAGGVALAGRRRAALVRAGLGLAGVMAALLVVVAIAGAAVDHPAAAPAEQAAVALRSALFTAATSGVVAIAVVVLALGAAAAAGAWLAGMWRTSLTLPPGETRRWSRRYR